MKLYDGGKVPNARRVRVFLAEKGISIPIIPVDLGKNEHKSTAFTGINPLQRVPALVFDDGSVLTESIAICRYFEETQPEPPLFGVGARGKAEVEMWQRQLELNLLQPIAHVFRHLHPAMATYEVPQVAEWGEANRGHASRYMTLLNAHLKDRPFVMGETFTVADITGLVALDFTRPARMTIPDGLPHLSDWYARLSARPSAKA
ncbi:MAG: glutathione S-transferase [Proteobacteria bacterium]|nr:glutathione S-transferase [Pseudomonadota bacterium]